MVPAIRTQVDGKELQVSIDTALTFDNKDHLTRQEFKEEADVNILLARFGVNQQLRQNPQYGTETDYGLDLQQALAAVASAKRADFQVPPELREKYPSWREVLNATESGEYQRDLANLAIVKAGETASAQRDKALAEEKAIIARRQRAEIELKRELEDRSPIQGTP